jgi:hypothetical protein
VNVWLWPDSALIRRCLLSQTGHFVRLQQNLLIRPNHDSSRSKVAFFHLAEGKIRGSSVVCPAGAVRSSVTRIGGRYGIKKNDPGAVQTVTPSEWIRVTIVYLSVPLILLV